MIRRRAFHFSVPVMRRVTAGMTDIRYCGVRPETSGEGGEASALGRTAGGLMRRMTHVKANPDRDGWALLGIPHALQTLNHKQKKGLHLLWGFR